MTRHTRPRPAFTLVELLVVIGIIVIIATLGFLFLPNLDRNKGVPNAVTQVEGWVNLSKQQALRDGRPHGIRFIDDGGGVCTSLQYIEQPDPLTFGVAYTLDLVSDTTTGTYVGNLKQGAANMPWDGVVPGDLLQVSNKLTGIAIITNVTGSVITLDRAIEGTGPVPVTLTNSDFKVIRSPRPLVGEPVLQMHKDVFIDLTQCSPAPVAPAGNAFTTPGAWTPTQTITGNIDLLFNANGQVAHATGGRMCIWVKHKERNDRLLVTVYTRTGKITAHQVNDGGDPYSFTYDGSSPGL